MAALVLAGSCAGFLATPQHAATTAALTPAPVAEIVAASGAPSIAAHLAPAPEVTPEAAPAPAENPAVIAARLARRATELADSASRSERVPFTRAPAAQHVIVRFDGHRAQVWTRAGTVGQLLAQLHVGLRPRDVVSPALSSRLQHGELVTVARIAGKRVTTSVRVNFDVTRVADPQLARGKERLVSTGSPGASTQVWALTYKDGKLFSRVLLSATVTTAPRPRVVAYGTFVPKPTPKPVVTTTSVGGYPTFGGLNWHALAHCESGNDQHSHDGPYHGLYQFLLDTWQSVGGSGDPADASIYEQTHRAWLLYQREGRHPWPVCGKYL